MKKFIESSGALLSMVFVQIFAIGLQLLSKVILTQGTFIYALVAYRNVVGAVFVAPFVYFFERDKAKNLNWSIAFWLFMNALTGMVMAKGLFYYGLRDTTASYATTILNLIPIMTFAFATIVRVEKLGLSTKAGKIKTLGAIVCVAGALITGLYKGKLFYVGHHDSRHSTVYPRGTHNFTRGTVFLVCSVLSYAIWFLVQDKLFKLFPYQYWGTLLTCVIGSVQATVVGLCLDRKKAAWKLGWDLQLVTIIYSGALATAATCVLISWVVMKKGPTYPPMFNPLSLILVVITGTLFLGEALTLGSLIGMVFIVVGLYSFLWGKNKELKLLKSMANQELPENSKKVVGEVSMVPNSVDTDDSAPQSAVVIMPVSSPAIPNPLTAGDDHHVGDETAKDANTITK